MHFAVECGFLLHYKLLSGHPRSRFENDFPDNLCLPRQAGTLALYSPYNSDWHTFRDVFTLVNRDCYRFGWVTLFT